MELDGKETKENQVNAIDSDTSKAVSFKNLRPYTIGQFEDVIKGTGRVKEAEILFNMTPFREDMLDHVIHRIEEKLENGDTDLPANYLDEYYWAVAYKEKTTGKRVVPAVVINNGVLDLTRLDGAMKRLDKTYDPAKQEVVPTEEWKGLYNTKFRRIVACKTSGYTGVDHHDVFWPFAQALRQEGIESFQARIEETAGWAKFQVLITDEAHTITPKDGKALYMGLKGHSAYGAMDAAQSMIFKGITGRGYCSNIFANKDLGEISIAHRGDLDKIKDKIANFIHTQRANSDAFLHKLDNAIDTPVDDPLVSFLVQACGFKGGKANDITAIYLTNASKGVEEGKNLYNVMNAITSHAKDAQSLTVQEEEIRYAANLIDNPDQMMRAAKAMLVEATGRDILE